MNTTQLNRKKWPHVWGWKLEKIYKYNTLPYLQSLAHTIIISDNIRYVETLEALEETSLPLEQKDEQTLIELDHEIECPLCNTM